MPLRRILALVLAAATAITARAEEDDRLLSSFARPAASAPRGQPLLPQEWDRRLPIAECFGREQHARMSGCFGPPVLREADAALLAAARQSQWARVLELLKSGKAGANAQDDVDGNALVLAARAGQEAVARELLRRGANTERLGDDGFTPLGAAAFAGHRGMVRMLLRAGADPTRWGASGQTALHLAAVAGRTGTLQALLQSGVDIETLNRQRETALDVAATASQYATMDALIQGGANQQLAGKR
jgi:uncharacterized protein